MNSPAIIAKSVETDWANTCIHAVLVQFIGLCDNSRRIYSVVQKPDLLPFSTPSQAYPVFYN
jgi:hypothetical protein